MSYAISTLLTLAFWRHLLLSWKTYRRALEVLGGLFVAAQFADFFGLYSDGIKQPWVLYAMFALSAAAGVWSRFPVTRVTQKIPGKDYHIEVGIGDILGAPNGIVVSTNTTFDASIKLIAADSLQGQFALRFCQGDASEIDRQLAKALQSIPFEDAVSPGKRRRYPLGTVAKVTCDGKVFYLLAMADLNEKGTAQANERDLDMIFEGLWSALKQQGELGEIYVPVIGTGRGRIQLPRQKVIERIAQSFVDASRDSKVANKLVIMVTDHDARAYDINLFQVRDYLSLSLHA
jgi:hypothetical protein